MFKKIHVIINPAAGKQEPILSYLNQAFRRKSVLWTISITHKQGDATLQATEAISQGADVVCAYGGDGTVTEVAIALHNTPIPLAIIPGGTANVLAKEFAIPANSLDAAKLVLSKKHAIKVVDMGKCNDKLFLLRISVGALANPIIETSRELKDTYGKIAYGITTLKHIGKPGRTKYFLTLDGKRMTSTAASLIIANIGNVGMEGFSLSPSISAFDGTFDVMRIKDTNLSTLAALVGNVLFKSEPDKVVKRWQAKKISLRFPVKQIILLDDTPLEAIKVDIEVIPKSIRLITPQ